MWNSHKSKIGYENLGSILYNSFILELRHWRDWRDVLGAIAPSSRVNLLFLKEYKNENIHLVWPHFDFWPFQSGCDVQ